MPHSMAFADRLAEAVLRTGAPACVGLDPHLAMLPPALLAPLAGKQGAERRAAAAGAVRRFCFDAIDAVRGIVAVLKPQAAFFEELGAPGVAALEDVVARAKEAGLLVIVDAKRGDIGTTAEAYAKGILDDDGPLGADAVTLSPYLGGESLEPFVRRCDAGKGVFVLLRTSNPGAGYWQVDGPKPSFADRIADWVVAQNASRVGTHDLGPIGVVVGATLPGEAAAWRARLPDAWFLVPGYGAQGATAEDVRGQVRKDGLGAIVNSSRAVLFPPKGAVDEDWGAAIEARARAFVDDLARVTPKTPRTSG